MAQKSASISSKNPEKEIELLKRALERQKKARQQAERILEEKSKELYSTANRLKEANERLEGLVTSATSELEGVFTNIVDPYIVMDLESNVLKMNNAAKEFFGVNFPEEPLNLKDVVHPDYADYTLASFQNLMSSGVLKNYQANLVLPNGQQPRVQVNSSLILNTAGEPIAAQGIVRDITSETEVKELISEQKRQLDIIVQNSSLGIVLTVDGKIVRSNQAFQKMLGYTGKELQGRTVKQVTVQESFPDSKKNLEAMEKGEVDHFTMVKKYRRKDGGEIEAKTSVSAVRNLQGELSYQVALIEDIGKELQAERARIASENRLSALVRNLGLGVLLENEARCIELVNQQFCNLFGIPVPPEQMKGADCVSALEEIKNIFADPEAFKSRVNEVLRKQETVLGDELELKDGRIMERDYIPIFHEGTYKGHLWTYNDVTIRKTYKRNLEIQKEKYSSIIANMNLGLLEVDNNEVIQLVNQSFCAMSGYEEKELLGKKASDIIRLKDPAQMLEKNMVRKTGLTDSYEIEVFNKQGEKRHWLISAAPRYDEQEEIVGSIGIHLDITDQKELELQKERLLKELEASNQGLQEYAHIVSHDLKSPLRSISALVTWMQQDYTEVLDDNGLFNLQLMQEKLEGMDKLIDGILRYSSIDTAHLKTERVDLNKVVGEIREIIYIPEHVQVVIMDTMPEIQADATMMHQLFQNLISNAVVNIDKREGLVTVHTMEKDSHYQFSVRDNGKGIPPAYHKKIFEIFQSVGDEARSTGIGLSIVKKIVDLYGGRIWLESEVGQGTTFHFTIAKRS